MLDIHKKGNLQINLWGLESMGLKPERGKELVGRLIGKQDRSTN